MNTNANTTAPAFEMSKEIKEFLDRENVPGYSWDHESGFIRIWGNWPEIWVNVPYTPEERARAEAASREKTLALNELVATSGIRETEAQFCARAQAAGF
jgi:hypothetical protein